MTDSRAWLAIALFFTATSTVVLAQQNASPYAGQQERDIKSLSAKDIEQIRTGKGWGLAKAAELNGVPGPRHVLQLSEELELSPDQIQQVRKSYESMHNDAVRFGSKLLQSESKLDELFQEESVTNDQLKEFLVDAAMARAELRYVHLSRHLEMLDILTSEQVATYNKLRGYD